MLSVVLLSYDYVNYSIIFQFVLIQKLASTVKGPIFFLNSAMRQTNRKCK